MLGQPAPVRCLDGRIGTNITWNIKEHPNTARDYHTGQNLITKQELVHPRVLVTLSFPIEDPESYEMYQDHEEQFKMWRGTMGHLLHQIYFRYKYAKSLANTYFGGAYYNATTKTLTFDPE
jgi:hypothetical protein